MLGIYGLGRGRDLVLLGGRDKGRHGDLLMLRTNYLVKCFPCWNSIGSISKARPPPLLHEVALAGCITGAAWLWCCKGLAGGGAGVPSGEWQLNPDSPPSTRTCAPLYRLSHHPLLRLFSVSGSCVASVIAGAALSPLKQPLEKLAGPGEGKAGGPGSTVLLEV